MWEANDLITIDEVAKLLGASTNTVYRWLRDGMPQRRYRGVQIDVEMLPDIKIGGKRYWSREATKELVEEMKH